MNLPQAFVDKMKNLLQEEFEAFIASYDEARQYGLRVNTLKISVEDFKKISPFALKPIPWTTDGFYYEGSVRPAKHPYYHAGLYYIQEPSAMTPGALFDVQPGEKVLDLCAAPGGKSLQIAAKLQGKGLLVTNDVSAMRVKPLSKNIELYGVPNAIITNEKPERLKNKFKGFFDKILIDAPCSGEGMFRKDPDLIKSWETHGVETCSTLQEHILEQTQEMLRPGGMLLYSTCTFSPEENEEQIAKFIKKYPEFELIEIPKEHGFSEGVPKWGNGDEGLKKCVRVWPHKSDGEGHFVAIFRKNGVEKEYAYENRKAVTPKEIQVFSDFVKENLNIDFDIKRLHLQGDRLYYLPIEGIPNLKGLKVVRDGWYLGNIKKNRFEPSQAFALGLKPNQVQRSVNFSVEDLEVIRYLKGETLSTEGEKGLTLITVDGYPLGFAKQMDHFLKNLYPSAWRWGS